MKKEEFIGYLRALEDMVDTKDERKLIKKIIARAQDIDVYPYYYKSWNYPWGPYWYGISTGQSTTIPLSTTTGGININLDESAGDKITLKNPTDWSVKSLDNGDFEIK